jgi:DNA polymerase III alpha subunit (gram-positive type)
LNYLFFDVECANSFDGVGKICEFGYVLTDENLNIIKQGIHLINPDAEFDWYVKYKIISYAIKEYEKAPKYPQIYRMHIQELVELPDTLYVGHGVRDDIKYLNDEANRYNLPRFERQCIDSSQIHRRFYNLPQTKGLKAIVKELEIGDHKKLHNSEYDAKMTLEYVKRMCEESGLSFEQLIKKHTKGKKKVARVV